MRSDGVGLPAGRRGVGREAICALSGSVVVGCKRIRFDLGICIRRGIAFRSRIFLIEFGGLFFLLPPLSFFVLLLFSLEFFLAFLE